ncbi:MAG: hypothetical protein WBE26_18380 [Phycisphaerae bacterium]
MSASGTDERTPCPPGVLKLVERMLSLHEQLDAAKTPVDKTGRPGHGRPLPYGRGSESRPLPYGRGSDRIEATDRQIDQLVHELCGLTDDEIRIVEEATQR